MNTDTTNIRSDANNLKGFDKYIRGPIKYFQRNWFIPFVLGLGSVTTTRVLRVQAARGMIHLGLRHARYCSRFDTGSRSQKFASV